MHCKFRWLPTLVWVGCFIFLTHCTRNVPESHLGSKQMLAQPYSMPVSAYLALSRNQTGTERQALELMAAGRAIYDGDWRNGLLILNRAGSMSGELADEKNLLLAKVDLIREQPNAAIAKLASVRELSRLSLYYQVQYHDMLASAYQATGALYEAVLERIKLDYLLPDEPSKANNRRALWLSLIKLSQPELDTLVAESPDNSVLKGWIALAEISRKQDRDPQYMLEDLRQWQALYPDHPAHHLLPSPLDTVTEHLFVPPKHMALLLPLTGALAGPGQAIQDGFMAAYQASGLGALKIRVYNTDQADPGHVYQQAIEEGADYVVGPLTKADVAVVARMSHPVPTILLNDVDRVSDGLAFQFGLSPSNEARQVAAKARKSGYSKALIIAPAGDWGTELVGAFSAIWTTSGGQVTETWQYSPDADLGAGIRHLLHASESAARIRPTKPVKGQTVDTAYQRRQDFDVIMLIAYPSKARQIMPLLRYYFAGDVPIFATSAVYSGIENTAKDRDLNGIIFCDMPWVFHHQLGQEHHWAEQLNSYNRLYALGMDSFTLAHQLNHLLLFPAVGINDKSGIVYLTKSHKLARILVFGQFKQGVARMLGSEQDKSML